MKPKEKKTEINIENVLKLCQEYLDFVFDESKYYEGSSYPEDIGWEMMRAVFGEDINDILFEKGEEISEGRKTGTFIK